MTDSTAARRALLRILLDRVDRDALLPAEVPLLRACVAAEEHAADTARFVTVQARADQATIARVHELAERWRYVPGLKDAPRSSLLRALDGPSPTPDDGERTGVDEDGDGGRVQCWHIEAGSGCDWDRCAQPDRLAAGDAGQDPAEVRGLCPTQFPDGSCAGTWHHPGDCSPNADDIPPPAVTDAPSEPQQ